MQQYPNRLLTGADRANFELIKNNEVKPTVRPMGSYWPDRHCLTSRKVKKYGKDITAGIR